MSEKKVEQIETEQSVTTLVTTDNVLQNIVQWKPQNVELIYGLEVGPTMSEEMFRKARIYTDRYLRAKAQPIDDYLNMPLKMCGVIMHMATVKNNDSMPLEHTVDAETGETILPSPYKSQYRTVFKVCAIGSLVESGVKWRSLSEPMFISFMATSIEQEVVKTFIPRYGQGDWKLTVPLVIRRVRTRSGGNAYNIEFIEE